MLIGALSVKLYAPWVHSLKEKRMVVQSLLKKMRNKFNVSVAEVEDMDVHQTITLGMACISNNYAHADSMMNELISFIDSNTEAEIIDIIREIR